MIYIAHAQDGNASDERIHSLIAAMRKRKCISLFIEPASRCNLKCRFCGFQKEHHKKKKGVMDAKTVEALCSVLRKTGLTFQNINFYNHGEPLCNRNLPDIIKKITGIVRADINKIVTNGVLLTPERLIELIDAGINMIKVSLDVGKKDRFLELKGADLFDITYQNIRYAMEYISGNNLDVSFVIKTCLPMAGGFVKNSDNKDVASLFEHACKDSRNIHLEIVKEYSWSCQSEKYRHACEAPFTQCVVNYDGVISACCADTDYALEIGNLAICDSLDEVIYGQKMRRIRKRMLGFAEDIPQHCLQCGIRTCVDIRACRDSIIDLI